MEFPSDIKRYIHPEIAAEWEGLAEAEQNRLAKAIRFAEAAVRDSEAES